MKPVPKHLHVASLLLGLIGAGPCVAAEVVGTAYTVLLRGHGPVQAAQPPSAQPMRRTTPLLPGVVLPVPSPAPSRQRAQPAYPQRPAATAGMQLVDARSGRTVGTATYDASIDGYMFRLPMQLNGPGGEACFLFKTAAGQGLPLRPEGPGDDGYGFRHPAWQAEAGRLGELAALQAELGTLLGDLERGAREIDALSAENQGVTAAGQCQPGPPQPDPPRPALALEAPEAQRAAGPLCALRWERGFEPTKVDPGRLFDEAGLGADWGARRAAAAAAWAAASAKLQLGMSDSEGALILAAAAKGRAFLEHAEGLRALQRTHGACKADALRVFDDELQSWQRGVAGARAAPLQAKARCEQRVARIEQLRGQQGAAPAYRQQLEQRIGTLERTAPPAADSARLDTLPCRGG